MIKGIWRDIQSDVEVQSQQAPTNRKDFDVSGA
jgi:hypothetical protein